MDIVADVATGRPGTLAQMNLIICRDLQLWQCMSRKPCMRAYACVRMHTECAESSFDLRGHLAALTMLIEHQTANSEKILTCVWLREPLCLPFNGMGPRCL